MIDLRGLQKPHRKPQTRGLPIIRHPVNRSHQDFKPATLSLTKLLSAQLFAAGQLLQYNTSNSLDKTVAAATKRVDFRKLGCLEEESVTLCVSHQTLSKPYSAQPAIVSRSHPHPLPHSADTHLQPKSYFLSRSKNHP